MKRQIPHACPYHHGSWLNNYWVDSRCFRQLFRSPATPLLPESGGFQSDPAAKGEEIKLHHAYDLEGSCAVRCMSMADKTSVQLFLILYLENVFLETSELFVLKLKLELQTLSQG
jgi:hypothetical protein